MQMREVLEVYHAYPPVGRFSFRRLVGVYGSGPDQALSAQRSGTPKEFGG